jgi:hypothetical protein
LCHGDCDLHFDKRFTVVFTVPVIFVFKKVTAIVIFTVIFTVASKVTVIFTNGCGSGYGLC